jgi:hypothetical protein
MFLDPIANKVGGAVFGGHLPGTLSGEGILGRGLSKVAPKFSGVAERVVDDAGNVITNPKVAQSMLAEGIAKVEPRVPGAIDTISKVAPYVTPFGLAEKVVKGSADLIGSSKLGKGIGEALTSDRQQYAAYQRTLDEFHNEVGQRAAELQKLDEANGNASNLDPIEYTKQAIQQVLDNPDTAFGGKFNDTPEGKQVVDSYRQILDTPGALDKDAALQKAQDDARLAEQSRAAGDLQSTGHNATDVSGGGKISEPTSFDELNANSDMDSYLNKYRDAYSKEAVRQAEATAPSDINPEQVTKTARGKALDGMGNSVESLREWEKSNPEIVQKVRESNPSYFDSLDKKVPPAGVKPAATPVLEEPLARGRDRLVHPAGAFLPARGYRLAR